MNKIMKAIICLFIYIGLIAASVWCWSYLESNDIRLIANVISMFIVGVAVAGFGILWIANS